VTKWPKLSKIKAIFVGHSTKMVKNRIKNLRAKMVVRISSAGVEQPATQGKNVGCPVWFGPRGVRASLFFWMKGKAAGPSLFASLGLGALVSSFP
jgi:hypothetical protein